MQLTDKQNEKMKSMITDIPVEKIISGHEKSLLYCDGCNDKRIFINQYTLHNFKHNKKIRLCHHRKFEDEPYKINKLTVSISIKYNSLNNNIITQNLYIQAKCKPYKLKCQCGKYIAKQIYNTEQYIECESETKPKNYITLRSIKKYVNRDVFSRLYIETYKLRLN